jgi:hypothetical protein
VTAPAKLDRAAFDALVQRRALALSTAAPARPLDRHREAVQEAQLLEAAATEFADAVDRSAQELPYEDAVVITGDAGVVVVDAAMYRREPIYWESRAGEVDSLTLGPALLAALRT